MIDTHLNLLRQFAESAEPMIYRLSGYLMATMMDDPAMLAFAFC